MNINNMSAKGKRAPKRKKVIKSVVKSTVKIDNNLPKLAMKAVAISLFLGLLVGTYFLTTAGRKNTQKILGPEEAMAAAEKFINENLLPPNIRATVKSALLEGNVYSINLNVQGQDYTSYITRDGSKFFQNGINIATYAQENAAKLAAANNQTPPAQQQNINVPKSDKPKVELFVMTHCPYGLQAEKGILPVFEALGNKIDASVKFVHYFLHGDKEEQESYNQLCLREEQAAKYNDYLKCFVEQGDSAKCQAQTGIDQAKLNSCLASKSKNYYQSDSALSQQYGVQGSPTLVINGVQSNAGRDAASYLAGICTAFNNAPAECLKQLSSASPEPGFGAINN